MARWSSSSIRYSIFNLVPLADLPAEYQARQAASQPNPGPDDDLTSGIDNLVDAFGPAKLDGAAQPLSASLTMVPAGFNLFPTQEGRGPPGGESHVGAAARGRVGRYPARL